jgi:hypothetical protein
LGKRGREERVLNFELEDIVEGSRLQGKGGKDRKVKRRGREEGL